MPLAYETASAISEKSGIALPIRATGNNSNKTNPTDESSKDIRKGNNNGKIPPALGSGDAGAGAGAEGGSGMTGAVTTTTAAGEDEAQREVVSKRLDALGYRVGQGLVERYVISPRHPCVYT